MIREKIESFKKYFKGRKIEVLVAIFLGIATLLVAWAGWIGALHDGNQAGNYTKSNNLAAEGNAEYNVAAQVYIADLFSWNTINGLRIDADAARARGDYEEAAVIENKIEKIKKDSCSPMLIEAMNKSDTSPFEDEEYAKQYFTEAQKSLNASREAMDEGEIDNQRSDSYQLASVLYSLVLFLLGIIGVLRDYKTRKMLLIFSVCILVVAVIYMLTIPMPTDFDFTSFFNNK